MIVFTVKIQPGIDIQGLLSDEVKRETMAQIMTTAEATALGFEGFGQGDDLCLIAVSEGDARWIEKALEREPRVFGYEPHRVDL